MHTVPFLNDEDESKRPIVLKSVNQPVIIVTVHPTREVYCRSPFVRRRARSVNGGCASIMTAEPALVTAASYCRIHDQTSSGIRGIGKKLLSESGNERDSAGEGVSSDLGEGFRTEFSGDWLE